MPRQSRRTAVIIAATAILLVAATITAVTLLTRDGRTSSSSTSSGITTATSPKPRTYGTQVAVADYTNIFGPMGVAVDTAGNVYVADTGSDRRVVKIAAGTNAQTTLPFTGLGGPAGVAVDTEGNVYLADSIHSRVLKLPVT